MATPIREASLSQKCSQNDTFRQYFKYYKRKQPPPDLSSVVDFETLVDPDTSSSSESKHEVFHYPLSTPSFTAIGGLKPINEWRAYGHKRFPGFVFIANPFKPGQERYWVKRCLHDYPCKPNLCNLDAHVSLATCDNLWDLKLSGNGDAKGRSLIERLRWVTMGYHHNWDTKEYSADQHTAFPDDLALLSRYIGASLGCSEYHPEASIVNYYHQDSTLSGHVDHSEFDLQAPLISISFGLPAVFLLGGTTKDVVPLPVFIRSGDVTILMGASRLAYHAVPKILAAPAAAGASSGGKPKHVGHGGEDLKPGDADPKVPGQHKRKEPGSNKDGCDPSAGIPKCIDAHIEDGVGLGAPNSSCEVPCKLKSPHSCESTVRESLSETGSKTALAGGDSAPDVATPSSNETGDDAYLLATVDLVNRNIVETLESLEWTAFEEYLRHCRINMNVRQVFKPGQNFPTQGARTDS